jgi:F-type H+-transporting ATPase subunit k
MRLPVKHELTGSPLPYQLAMATLGSIFAGSWAAMGGGEKPKTAQGPPINASSKDEENFIQYVLRYIRVHDAHQCSTSITECNTDCPLPRNFMKEVDGGEKKPNQH